MEDFHDNVLYQTNQHIIVLFTKILKIFFIVVIPFSVLIGLIFQDVLFFIIFLFCLLCLDSLYCYFFWKKSYFLLSNYKISIKVRNGFFSKFHMSIYYKNIRDTAYSKNHFLHYLLNYGTFFARSSAGADGDFEAKSIPDVEKVYKYVNYIFTIPENQRHKITTLDGLDKYYKDKNILSQKEIIDIEKKNILSILGIKEVILLNNEDRKFIFENEEDRNHGVYETIRRKILLAVTHDSSFRDADNNIVLKRGKKILFPGVSFHEVKQKNTISSSPCLEVHNYLKTKFINIDSNDATILIGFDL